MTLQTFLQISLEFLIIYIIFLRYTYKLMEASHLFSTKMNTNHVYIQVIKFKNEVWKKFKNAVLIHLESERPVSHPKLLTFLLFSFSYFLYLIRREQDVRIINLRLKINISLWKLFLIHIRVFHCWELLRW